jgi:phosphate acetyltransferase
MSESATMPNQAQLSRHHFLNDAPCCPSGLIERARRLGPLRIVIVCANAALPMLSCRAAVNAELMEPIFVGPKEAVRTEAQNIGWDISGFKIVDVEGEGAAAEASVALVREGLADALMKGQIHTDILMRAALNRNHGIRDGGRLIHVFHITPPHSDRPQLFTDAAVNVRPDMETMKVAIRAVVDVARAVGIERPKVALLLVREEPIPAVPSAKKSRELAQWATKAIPGSVFSGPLSLDLILSREAALAKRLYDDEVAGAADAIVVPDTVSGNVLFKSLVCFRAAGVVVGGRVPVILTSRADPPETRLASVALANVLSNQNRCRKDFEERVGPIHERARHFFEYSKRPTGKCTIAASVVRSQLNNGTPCGVVAFHQA